MGITIDINNGQRRLEVDPGLSLLVHLAKNQIFLPSACGGRARCGYCKVQVTTGGSNITAPEEALIAPELRAGGFRLACQFKPVTDIGIQVPPELFSIKRFTAKVVQKKLWTHDIMGLQLELISPATISFVPGQYISLRSAPYANHEATLRSFSIANPPSDNTHIELMIRLIPNGVCTPWVFDHLKEGENVTFNGPFGSFHLTDSNVPALFIAGSSGMAPLWSMLRHLREKGVDRTVSFYFGALARQDLFLTDELKQLEKEIPGFTFIPALSNEPEQSDWRGERGLVPDVVARHYSSCSGMEAFLCGSPGMINAAINRLLNLGMPDDKIHCDRFK